jgi:hypothetical protein
MVETLQSFVGAIVDHEGTEFEARSCGAEMPHGLWHGWIEFIPLGDGEPIRSPRETTQPNRTDAVYCATGLSRVYLEGALRRAQTGPIVIPSSESPRPIFDAPAPRITRE